MQSDIVERLRAVLHNDRSVELMNREAAAEITRLRAELSKKVDELAAMRLRAELAAAKKRIEELEDALPRPTLSRCLQLEESLRHPKKEGGGA